MPNPTIVAASLDDKELRASIDSLVKDYKTKLGEMVTETNNVVTEIKNALGGKTTSDTSKTKTATKDTQELSAAKKQQANVEKEVAQTVEQSATKTEAAKKREKKANDELTASFDQQAAAQRKATQSPAESSYYTFVKNMRENVALLAMEIKSMPNLSFDRQFANYQQYEVQIERVRQRIAELRQELANERANPNGSRIVQKQLIDSIADEQQRLVQLEREQVSTTDQIAAADQKVLAEKQAQYETEKRALMDLSVGKRERVDFARQEAVQEGEITAEIKKQAELIRRNKKFQTEGFMRVDMGGGHDAVIYAQSRLSIEEQLVAARREVKRIADNEMVTDAALLSNSQAELGVAKERLVTEQAITETRKKQYERPISYTMGRGETSNLVSKNYGITNADAAASLNKLTLALKEAQSEYNRLSATERNSSLGQVLRTRIQEIEVLIRRVRAQASRPVDLDTLFRSSGTKNLDEYIRKATTLEEIQHRMRQLTTYRSGLNADTQKNEIQQVNAALDQLKKKEQEIIGTNHNLLNSNNALTRSWNYMKNRLAFYFTVGAGTQFIKSLIEVRSQYEMNERALGILIGSAEYGTRVFQELSQMSLVSPYTLIELSAAAKQLTAYDIAAKDVVDTTRRLADMAAAVGVPIERLTYALGQIKAYGYLNSRDARMFLNAGIPLVKQLAERYTQLEGRLVSVGDVYDRIKKKAVGYADVMQVITEMTDEGGRFFDFQAKMADTLKVRLANLTLAWNNMLNEMGESNQGYMTSGIKLLTEFFKHWRDVEKTFLNVALGFGILKALQYATLRFHKLNHAVASTAVLGEKAAASMNGFAASITKAASKGWNWILVGIMAGVDFYQTWQNASEAVKEFNRTVAKNAEESGKNLREWRLQAESAYGGVTSGRNLTTEDAGKAWADMREQIEMSSQASQRFIGSLEQIPDINNRLRAGFNVVDEIQKAHAALQDLGEDSIQITQEWSAWWNLWSANDGLKNNLKDFVKLKDEASGFNLWSTLWDAVASTGLLGAIHEIAEGITTIRAGLQGMTPDELRFKEDIDAMAESMVNQSMNLSATAAREFFDKIAEDYVHSQNLSATEALTFRMHLEEAYSNKRKDLYQKENASMAEENIRAWDAAFGKSKALVEDFYNFLGRNNQSALLQLFKDKDAAEIDAIAKSDTAWQNFIYKQAKTFAEQRNIEFEALWQEINNINANAKIFIPVILQFTEKSELQKEVDRASTGLNIHVDVADASTTYDVAQNLLKRKNEIQEALRGIGDATTDMQRKEKAAYESELAATNAVLDNLGYANLRTKQELKDARAAASARKRAAAQQREAESELQKTLNNELKIIDKVRERFKALSAIGYDRTTAVQMATRDFTKSQAEINAVFAKWGLEALDLSKLAGATNPREIFNVLQAQLNKLIASGKVKPVEIQPLETKVGDLRIDADKFDGKTLVESLNSAFSKIKDEYELAIAFDESPELGSLFSSLMGLDEDYMRALPRTMSDVAMRMQAAIAKALTDSPFKVAEKDVFNIFSGERLEDWAKKVGITKDSDIYKQIDQMYSYYLDTVRKTLSNVEKEYDNLVRQRGDVSDKLEEIESRRLRRIRELEDTYDISSLSTTERGGEVTRVDNAAYLQHLRAINNDAAREEANALYEAFKNMNLYIKMFEDLGFASEATLTHMKAELDSLRTSLKGLSPQNLKEIVKQMQAIDDELIRRKPFKGIVGDFKNYVAAMMRLSEEQERYVDANDALMMSEEVLANTKKQRAKAEENGNRGEIALLDKEIAEQERLVKLLKEDNDEAEKNLTITEHQIKTFAKKAQVAWNSISANIDSLVKLRDELEASNVDVGNWLNGVIDGMSTFNEGVNQAISSVQRLDAVGALAGVGKAVYGVVDSVISIFGGGSAKEHRINRELKKSERQVKRLQYLYVDLQHAMEDAYGAAESGARRVALANKQLELQEIQRQIRLEKSRSKKKRDEDRILELEQQYKELARDIKTSTDEIVNDLLGNDRASFAENLVSSMIDAFRQGEDYMKVFEDSFDEMVDNMIMKAIVSRVVAKYVDAIFDGLDERIENRSSDEKAAFQEATKRQAKVEHMTDDAIRKELAYQKMREDSRKYRKYEDAYGSVTQAEIEAYRKTAQNAYDDAEERYRQAATMNKSDIDWLMSMRDKMGGAFPQELIDAIGEFYQFGQDANKDLSQLQQGIQGITETTANALEAYWNANTQQQYVQSDLLTQIRDAVVAQDADVQMATMGQILLQLQASYNVHMSIRNTLDGWSAANGMAVRVQMV